MKFDIEQGPFLSALSLAQTVADRRSTMPVLANVLLTADADGHVTCSATDMMIAVSERVPANVEQAGGLTLGVRHLHALVRTLSGGSVSIESLDNHWAQILASRSEFKLMGMPDTDFPELPSADKEPFTEVSAAGLMELVTRTLFSVSSDEARVNLNGALFECDGKTATMVSTDGHRLTKFTGAFAGPKLDEGIIIPRKGLLELKRVLDRFDEHCEMSVGAQHLFVRDERLTISIKLNSVRFPPYGQVIPASHDRKARATRSELMAALRSVVVLAPEKTATVRVQLETGNLALTADNPDAGVAHQELPVEYDGDSLVAGFNAHYLLAALEAMDTETIDLEFQGELDPCVLRPVDGPDFLAVVMPMRI
jgi:DNA polymerase-3 subunit beta